MEDRFSCYYLTTQTKKAATAPSPTTTRIPFFSFFSLASLLIFIFISKTRQTYVAHSHLMSKHVGLRIVRSLRNIGMKHTHTHIIAPKCMHLNVPDMCVCVLCRVPATSSSFLFRWNSFLFIRHLCLSSNWLLFSCYLSWASISYFISSLSWNSCCLTFSTMPKALSPFELYTQRDRERKNERDRREKSEWEWQPELKE